MGHIFRHKENKKLYTIEHLIKDIYHLNRNGFSGIYATPYKWKGETIKYILQQKRYDMFNPEKFVEDNFEIVRELEY